VYPGIITDGFTFGGVTAWLNGCTAGERSVSGDGVGGTDSYMADTFFYFFLLFLNKLIMVHLGGIYVNIDLVKQF
jgi:hypothetical protein